MFILVTDKTELKYAVYNREKNIALFQNVWRIYANMASPKTWRPPQANKKYFVNSDNIFIDLAIGMELTYSTSGPFY